MADVHKGFASVNMRSPAVKRIFREYAELLKEPSSQYAAAPLEDNIFEWHFTVRGPPGTEFEGGHYHGRILLPNEYPLKPPSIMLLTPNGRFEVGKKICLSITGHHPEYWQPAWGIRTALLAIMSFMPTEGKGAIGALDHTPEERKILAKRSRTWSCPACSKSESAPKLSEEEPEAADAQSEREKAAKELQDAGISLYYEGARPAETSTSDTTAASSSSSSKPELLEKSDASPSSITKAPLITTVGTPANEGEAGPSSSVTSKDDLAEIPSDQEASSNKDGVTRNCSSPHSSGVEAEAYGLRHRHNAVPSSSGTEENVRPSASTSRSVPNSTSNPADSTVSASVNSNTSTRMTASSSSVADSYSQILRQLNPNVLDLLLAFVLVLLGFLVMRKLII